ncbi:hypothetical protein [Streptomyces sp. CG 926]|uniref:hypothetical protein n=1 Tax=Streptomyces sp. CG 926 TaxID=1882405 RepID=UPI0035BFC4E2
MKNPEPFDPACVCAATAPASRAALASSPPAGRRAVAVAFRRTPQPAGKRHLAAGQSLRPRSRQNRIGNAAARRDARALSRVRHSNAWLW